MIRTISGKLRLKKNCYSCFYKDRDDEYLEGHFLASAFTCTKRKYKNPSDELKHLDQMQQPMYLEKEKRCWGRK